MISVSTVSHTKELSNNDASADSLSMLLKVWTKIKQESV